MGGQTVIDVGTSSWSMSSPGGRKFKKTRVGRGGGLPVSSSAASAAGEIEVCCPASIGSSILCNIVTTAAYKLESALCCN